ncbi:CpsD/CapB family tyrosine-protein kinase [Scopulibacillus cellulosilyticus]|uniref:non-specific protein-tyrosine kinase n=1 Tax=Scopulibacillus cellulosilyticus TaxID=2665665 RepID=A0ABW2Q0K3_9BACL
MIGNKQRSLITYRNPKSPISEQFRTIRTNIEFSSVDKEMRTVMVTSSSPGEGKSTTVANLAVTIAQQGKKVLLVDTDLRKPTVHYTFRQANTQGLTSLLTKQTTFESIVKKTEVENLYVLPSGPIPPNPAELLASTAMKSFIKHALTMYDMIVFDTPPVLAVTDAQVMTNLCDGTVLVIQSGETEKEAALKAKELLLQAKGTIVGTVLNRKPQKKSNYYYYYAQS